MQSLPQISPSCTVHPRPPPSPAPPPPPSGCLPCPAPPVTARDLGSWLRGKRGQIKSKLQPLPRNLKLQPNAANGGLPAGLAASTLTKKKGKKKKLKAEVGNL